MKKYITVLCLTIVWVSACTTSNEKRVKIEEKVLKEHSFDSRADRIISKMIATHGGSLYDNAYYSFTFRDKKYTFKNNYGDIEYTRAFLKNNHQIFDAVTHNSVVRLIDGDTAELTEKQIKGISSSIGSVVYFATLPHKLNDKAVNKIDRGTTIIKESQYYVIEVNFNEEGGGEDHQDIYHYWINQETNEVDFLAYNYQVNKGGVRFRTAFNKRKIEGVIFQDYKNYKAPVGTPLADLPALWEKGELELLSVISTENVVSLNK